MYKDGSYSVIVYLFLASSSATNCLRSSYDNWCLSFDQQPTSVYNGTFILCI